MIDAIGGRLLSPHFARNVLPSLPGATTPPPAAERQIELVGETASEQLGPTSSARLVADTVLLPLLRVLDLHVLRRIDSFEEVHCVVGGAGPSVVPVLVRAWKDDLDLAWRGTVREGIAADTRWCVATNGRHLRFIDAHRTWSRHAIDIDVASLSHDSGARRLLWAIANSHALTRVPAMLDTAAALSNEHGTRVCRSLGQGVVKALHTLFEACGPKASRPANESRLLDQCLTVIYRILFLLFAEARGLVPMWHPVYRDRYTIEGIVATLMAGRPCPGAWRAVQAISRMAHTGCTAGALAVTAFNGRLFSPEQTAGLDTHRVDDQTMQAVLLGLSTTRSEAGVTRTRYDELDVEHLGSVYEHLLEYQPGDKSVSPLVRTRDTRKSSGTFYTPREIAASLVQRTLEPLVAGRTAEQILRLRILDPAMGSGAFLVAASRYLAREAEEALVADGRWHVAEVTEVDRTALRREIVQRCLYGVDINPVAAQLARLSLWLVALARDKPLTFLDHHLIVGNSLVGASPSDIHRNTGASPTRRNRAGSLPLFDNSQLASSIAAAGAIRVALALEPDDTASTVRSKGQRLATIGRSGSALSAWKRVLDLWCATWFWERGSSPNRATVAEVSASLLTGHSSLRRQALETILNTSDQRASEMQFLHWPLVFPEVFHDQYGRLSDDAGFDAVIGNPPWDMVRGDSGDDITRGVRRREAHHLARFVRDAGIYRTDVHSHLNRYVLFTERALQLVRRSGRVGLVLPGGVLTDAGTASLRRRLFSTTDIDAIVGIENRTGIFQAHRSLKFVLLTATAGTDTQAIRCRFGVSRLEDVDGAWHAPGSISVTPALIARISGNDDLGLPQFAASDDLRIVESITARIPALDDASGWHVRFGRELNATDDRALMVPSAEHPEGRPVVEGKMLTPFRVATHDCRLTLRRDAEGRHSVPRHERLAYREIASSTNRLTLIAAMVPARAVTTHTVFCLKSILPEDSQHVLCAMLNSFIANYLIRMRVGTHVTAAIMAKLRVPRLDPVSEAFRSLATMSRTLTNATDDIEASPVFAEMQALVARLYGLERREFGHVLSTFPLVAEATRDACLRAFETRLS